MIIRISMEELATIQRYPLPWWAPEPREALGRVKAGIPVPELGEDGTETGFFLMSHPSLDSKDLFLLEVLRAGWAYIADMTAEEQDYLQKLQMANDWQAWSDLKASLESASFDGTTPALTKEVAQAHAWEYAVGVAATLGIIPPVEDVDVP